MSANVRKSSRTNLNDPPRSSEAPEWDAFYLHNEQAAREYIEARRWPDGPVCFHCESRDRIGKLTGKSNRSGLYKCYNCRLPFNVKLGTVFQSSHLPLRTWLHAIEVIAQGSSKTTYNRLAETLDISIKTAWSLRQLIRTAMDAQNPKAFRARAGRWRDPRPTSRPPQNLKVGSC